MIADIEFRWVKREVNKDMLTSKPADYERVLQFRKKIMKSDPFGAWIDEWTPWQDVPVVEECGP